MSSFSQLRGQYFHLPPLPLGIRQAQDQTSTTLLLLHRCRLRLRRRDHSHSAYPSSSHLWIAVSAGVPSSQASWSPRCLLLAGFSTCLPTLLAPFLGGEASAWGSLGPRSAVSRPPPEGLLHWHDSGSMLGGTDVPGLRAEGITNPVTSKFIRGATGAHIKTISDKKV